MVERTAPYQPRRNIKRFHACQTCNIRKVRCNGEQPECASCRRSGLDCVYKSRRQARPLAHDLSHAAKSTQSISPIDLELSARTSQASATFDAGGVSRLPTTALDNRDASGHPTSTPDEASPHLFDIHVGHFDTYLPTVPLADRSYNAIVPPTHEPTTAHPPRDPILCRFMSAQQEEQLLYLYFMNQRYFPLEMHVPTFFEKRASPDLTVQPHRCLILAMILVTTPAVPWLQERDTEIYEAIRQAIDDAIGQDERPFDALRAAALAVTWLIGRADYLRAWTMVGVATRIVIFCGLDYIPSSRLERISQNLPVVRRSVGSCLSHPTSQIELAERIYAFWAVFLLDRFMSIGCDWPPNLDYRTILTPLPLSWGEYLEPRRKSSEPEERLQDFLEGKSSVHPPINSTYLIKLSLVMEQASIRGKFVPPNDGDFRYSVPPELDKLEAALSRILQSMPTDLMAISGPPGNRHITPWAAILHLLVGTVEIYMYDTNSYRKENTKALAAVRRMLAVMRLLGEKEIGDMSLFVIMIWHEMIQALIIETKRLERAGRSLDAVAVDAEIDFVLACMRQKGKTYRFADLQADGLESWRTRAPSEDP